MKHLIIYAHPNEDSSFNAAILQQVLQVSNKNETTVRKLYSLNFNPVLTSNELQKVMENNLAHDVLVEQAYIKTAELITFIYPLWWMGFPAILKGYIDRVFSHGFAYQTTAEKSEGLLKDKKINHIITLGSELAEYEKLGFINGLEISLLHGLFNFCGIYDIKQNFYGNIHNLSNKERQTILNEVSHNMQKLLNSKANSGSI